MTAAVAWRQGCLDALTLPEVAAWLCLFISDSPTAPAPDDPPADAPPDARPGPGPLPEPSPALVAAWAQADAAAAALDEAGLGGGGGGGAGAGGGSAGRRLGLVMLEWCGHKDVARVAARVEPLALGAFVRAALRVAARVDAVREARAAPPIPPPATAATGQSRVRWVWGAADGLRPREVGGRCCWGSASTRCTAASTGPRCAPAPHTPRTLALCHQARLRPARSSALAMHRLRAPRPRPGGWGGGLMTRAAGLVRGA
jgi:hypothetical protein